MLHKQAILLTLSICIYQHIVIIQNRLPDPKTHNFNEKSGMTPYRFILAIRFIQATHTSCFLCFLASLNEADSQAF